MRASKGRSLQKEQSLSGFACQAWGGWSGCEHIQYSCLVSFIDWHSWKRQQATTWELGESGQFVQFHPPALWVHCFDFDIWYSCLTCFFRSRIQSLGSRPTLPLWRNIGFDYKDICFIIIPDISSSYQFTPNSVQKYFFTLLRLAVLKGYSKGQYILPYITATTFDIFITW